MLKSQWNRFFWGMVVVVVLLLAVMAWEGKYYSGWSDYYKAIWPGFIATAFGVIFSFAFAGALWTWQLRAENGMKRDRLIKNIEFELENNEQELKSGEFIFENGHYETGRINDYMLFVGECLHLTPLRKVALDNYLKDENELLLNEPKLERGVSALVEDIEKYNDACLEIIRLEGPNSPESALGAESAEKRINNVNIAKTIMSVNHLRLKSDLASVKEELIKIRQKSARR